MKSKWYEYKEEVIRLRREGMTYDEIKKQFNVPKSTLSNWLTNVKLSPEKLKILQNKRWISIQRARKHAVRAHNSAKEKRLSEAKEQALEVLERLNSDNIDILEISLAMLYWGEGFKKTDETAMGNSDPKLLNFFIACVEKIYSLDRSKLKPELHLRADQSPRSAKRYWAKALNIPVANFGTVSIDNRTEGRKTYAHYKGVCVLRLGSVAIQRRILYIIDLFSEKIIESARSSAG